MKPTLLLCLLLVAIGSYAQSVPAAASPVAAGPVVAVDLVGTWHWCSTAYTQQRRNLRGQMVAVKSSEMYNVCPEVTFQADGTGQVIGGDGRSIEKFNWMLQADTLRLVKSRRDVTPQSYDFGFSNAVYRVSPGETVTDLWLISPDRSVKYLGRGN